MVLVDKISKYKWSSYSEYISNSKIVDIDFVLNIFDKDRKKAITMFKDFHEKSSEDKCLDIIENKRLKDEEAIEIIKNTCNIPHCIDLQKLEKDDRDKYLKSIKEKGLSTRQLSRLTGISRGVLLKA